MGRRLTESGVRRRRLRAQLLAGRGSAAPSVEEVVGRLVGVQAQDVTAAGLAVRARSRGLVAADVNTAREAGRVILTWSLRGTRHLHRVEDVRGLVGLVGPAFLGPSRRADELGIGGATGTRAVRVLRDALAAEGPLTRDEVKARLEPHGVDRSGQAAIHVIARAALEGHVIVLPGERYALIDEVVGSADASTGHLGELARRYLAGFGPATPDDFSSWSGLGLPAARRAWSDAADDLVEVGGPAGPVWRLAADADADADGSRALRSAGVRLLGAFDSLLLGYADRRLHLSDNDRRLVNPGGGMVKPLLVVDGVVAGTWSRPGGRVEVSPWRPLTDGESAAVAREAADVARFLVTPDRSPRT